MTDSAVREQAGRRSLVRGLTAGLVVHAAATAVFFLVQMGPGLDGCDPGDGVFGASGIAGVADLLFGGVVTDFLLKRRPSCGRGILAGMAISYSAAVLMCVLVALNAKSFVPACPV
jgi:hypothetical protein